MNWSNVKLIFRRELRDQLRDRRTLFMICILPLLLYPLLGMVFMQLSQFLREHKPKILVVGNAELEVLNELPPLFAGDQFAADLTQSAGLTSNMQIEFVSDEPYTIPLAEADADKSATADATKEARRRLFDARQKLDSGDYEAVVYLPPDFGQQLLDFRQRILRSTPSDHTTADAQDDPAAPSEDAAVESPIVEPEVYYNSANEKSRLAYRLVESVVNQWALAVGQQNLRDRQLPELAAKPFQVEQQDVAEGSKRHAAVWSKILPFVVIIWALTGAFYPAVDLCAGEKERGTLETLLASPALRNEIVWGKLLTVMIFSVTTAVLNLFSLGLTGKFVISQLGQLPGASGISLPSPPLEAGIWLLIALLPVSALFSALCLAMASLAKSTKEGQYYLMPLILVAMPLMMLPMNPSVELNLGNSLIPLTGLVLLLRVTIEGNYAAAIPYIAPVVGVTLICCLLAIRWAVEQFNKEAVLFPSGDRLDLSRWAVHLFRDRHETPTVANAFTCVVLIFVIQFFLNFAMTSAKLTSYQDVALLIFIGQVVVFLVPVLMMTLLLSRRPLATLLLNRLPNPLVCLGAVLMACTFHPVGQQIGMWITQLYPTSQELAGADEIIKLVLNDAPLGVALLLLAGLPAVCEETAFRGFILSGFRHLGHKWWAIGLSAVFFGLAHGLLQQSLAAAVTGLMIGYIAVQSGSLIPCMLFHATYNSLSLINAKMALNAQSTEAAPALKMLYDTTSAEHGVLLYHWPVIAVGAVLTLWGTLWLHRLPYQATREEQLEAARERQTQQTLLGEV